MSMRSHNDMENKDNSPPLIPRPSDSKSKHGGHPNVFIKTFGWPYVQVPHDDTGDFEDGNWL